MNILKKSLILFLTLMPGLFAAAQTATLKPYLEIPTIDLDQETFRQVVIDKEEAQYLGHPTTVLYENGKTMLAIYPKGHGKGEIVMKRSKDGGITWSERIELPESWKTSKETPTIHRLVDAKGKKRLIVFSGLYPVRMAFSEDDGSTWSELNEIGDWGGVVIMSAMLPLNSGKGHYMGLFHDDLRFMTADGQKIHMNDKVANRNQQIFTLFKTYTFDGGLTWTEPEKIMASRDMYLCEPAVIRSPDGKQIAVILRENSRRYNSQIIFSDDEGETWSDPRALPNELTGDRHVMKYTHDGRLLIVFRDISPIMMRGALEKIARERNETNYSLVAQSIKQGSPTEGDWVAWVGSWDDIINGGKGQYRVRLKDNYKNWDCGYSGLEMLHNQTFVATSYGHWEKDQSPYILSVRFKIKELDKKFKAGKFLPVNEELIPPLADASELD